MTKLKIFVSTELSAKTQDTEYLAGRLDLSFIPYDTFTKQFKKDSVLLCYTDDGLCIKDWRHTSPTKVIVDFVNGRAQHRREFGGGRNQAMAKALGLKKGLSPCILDTTAGMGKDSFVAASLGCEVIMIERQNITYALLENGIERARLNDEIKEIILRMSLHHSSAINYLEKHSHSGVIYLDPMYPHHDKSALAKKEMQLFREIAGDDDDANLLLEASLDSDAARVVVKRPKGAPFLGNIKTTTSVKSKNTRYDIYSFRKL